MPSDMVAATLGIAFICVWGLIAHLSARGNSLLSQERRGIRIDDAHHLSSRGSVLYWDDYSPSEPTRQLTA